MSLLPRLVLAALLIAVTILAGCSAPAGVVPDQARDGAYLVHLTSSNQFDPDDIRVPVGATVRFTVTGGAHDVSAEDGTWSSGSEQPLDDEGFPLLLAEGQTYNHTFQKTGRFVVWCHTHHEEDMRLVVRVQDS